MKETTKEVKIEPCKNNELNVNLNFGDFWIVPVTVLVIYVFARGF